jgi:glycosyltransferase involved in cell wall biosynthesis
MITVVHIITKLEMGGAQENTIYTCRHLDRARFKVILLHGAGGFLDQEAASMPNTEVISLPNLVREIDPKKDLWCLADLSMRLRKLNRQGKVVLHTHSSKAGILGRVAAKAAGINPVIHSIHGFSFHEGQALVLNRGYVAAEQLSGKMTHGFIGVSRANLAEARARGIINSHHKVALIRSGFDVEAFSKASQLGGKKLREEMGISPDQELIVSIANLKPQKDPITMVRATEQLIKKRPKVTVLYAGDGPLRTEVEQEIARLGLKERFRLLGWRRDVPALMGAADVIALSSIFEGLPRVSVQAVVARKPFVGTRVDGTPEIIRDGKNGYLVEPRDPTAFCDALDRALTHRPQDPEDINRVKDWNADEMVRAQERFYEELLSK